MGNTGFPFCSLQLEREGVLVDQLPAHENASDASTGQFGSPQCHGLPSLNSNFEKTERSGEGFLSFANW